MKNTFFFLICSGIFISCINRNKVPGEIIQPKEMQKILWDMMRAQSLSSELARKDSSINEATETKALTKKIFEIHKIDSQSFDISYKWYTSHPDVLKVVFDSLNSWGQRQSEIEMPERAVPLKSSILKKIKPE